MFIFPRQKITLRKLLYSLCLRKTFCVICWSDLWQSLQCLRKCINQKCTNAFNLLAFYTIKIHLTLVWPQQMFWKWTKLNWTELQGVEIDFSNNHFLIKSIIPIQTVCENRLWSQLICPYVKLFRVDFQRRSGNLIPYCRKH